MISVRWIFIYQSFISISSAHAEDLLYEESDPNLLNFDPSSIFDDDLLALNEPNVGPLDELTPSLPYNSDWPTGAAVNVDDGTKFAMLDTTTPDLFDTDLGNADSTYSISADDGFEAASSTCSASRGGLGRRELSVCPVDRPDLEYELRFDKTGERFFFMSGNPAICGMFEMCPGCLYAVCDSGVQADRIPTLVPLVYDLNSASPLDLAKGCFSPHDIWCCGNPFFGDFEDHNLLSYPDYVKFSDYVARTFSNQVGGALFTLVPMKISVSHCVRVANENPVWHDDDFSPRQSGGGFK